MTFITVKHGRTFFQTIVTIEEYSKPGDTRQ